MSGLVGAQPAFDLIDSRPLAALQFVSAVTGLPIEDPVRIVGAKSVRTARGLYALLEPDDPVLASGLAAYAASFPEPPAAPAPGSVALDLLVEPVGSAWLARRLSLPVPLRPGAPGDAEEESDEDEEELGTIPFQRVPLRVPLFPSPSLAIEPSWTVLRVRVTLAGSSPPLPLGGVLLQAWSLPGDVPPHVAGRGQSDARGEALLALPLEPLVPGAELPRIRVEARRDNRIDAYAYPPNPHLLLEAVDEPWLKKSTTDAIECEPGVEYVLAIEMD